MKFVSYWQEEVDTTDDIAPLDHAFGGGLFDLSSEDDLFEGVAFCIGPHAEVTFLEGGLAPELLGAGNRIHQAYPAHGELCPVELGQAV